MTKTSTPGYDRGTGYAIAATLTRVRQIIRYTAEGPAYKDDKPCQRICAAIIKQIDEEFS